MNKICYYTLRVRFPFAIYFDFSAGAVGCNHSEIAVTTNHRQASLGKA